MTLDDALARHPGAATDRPGDSAALNAEILALMRAGRKTATCAALAEFSKAEPAPEVGRTDIALDWQGRPALATRTTAVERLRYADMDAARVPPQREFADLQDWQRGYARYFARMGAFDPGVEMICERFEMVEDFGG
ncbi:ASCH domain-containing protein [Rhodobacter sp. Har01]|uniref:ASCH domain-containing protein n=1 Tax=Rhodobacter sp. Har01 TaxID=2883999 RepID=UPI001D08B4D0|nr:ASCH domain-containing protein [Rhodobacter sp. Har01]MCB6176942.1 ASCH domain-containing protein [Rhodobacter sp. Har01]